MERLLDYFVPEKYDLDLKIDKNKKTIGGRVDIIGKALTNKLKFHAVALRITEVLINGESAKFAINNDVLEIDLSSELVNQNVEIRICYDGTLNENMEGAYLSTYEYNSKTETIVATQFESHYAREAFPCIDEPAAKAVFDLSITLPKDSDDLVLANMPVKTVVKNTTIFETTPRMSTYLLAWVIGKFHGKTIMNKHGVEITTYCALNQDVDSVDFANEIAALSLEFYDDNFKEPYPLKKLDQVALPDFEAGAMENWGLVTYRESMLLVGKNATLATKKGVALTVAHELSHQWFGDLVTMEWWDDLWLNESFASVMEYYAVDYIHPEYHIFEGFFTGDAYAALLRDAYKDVQSVHQEVHDPAEIATLFDSAIVYSKGARLMLMLIRAMGWENFCKGVADYFNKFKYKNTVGDDLWQALEPYAEFMPKELMHAFIDKPGYPVITKGKQQRFLLDGEMREEEWPIPEVTEDMSGHYLINHSEEEFEKRLKMFDELSLEEKIRLLIDRGLLARTELASSGSLLRLLPKFKNENNAAVWSIILSIVGNLKIFFDDESKEEAEFKRFVAELVADKLKEIGIKTRKTDDENILKLRKILLAMDFYAEVKDDLEVLSKLYSQTYEKIEAEIREDVLDAKLYLEPEVVDDYIKAYQETADPEIKFELLFAGTLSKNEKVLDKMIELLSQPEIVKPQDQLYLFIYLYRNPKSREKTFLWMKEYWEEIKKTAGDKSIENYPRYTANAIRTEADYEEWLDYFEPMSKDSALKRAIKIGKNEIKARLKLINEDRGGVYQALREH